MPALGDYLAGNTQAALQGEMGYSPDYMETARNQFKRQLNEQFYGSPTGETVGEFARSNRELAKRGLTSGGAPTAKNVALASNMMNQERQFEENLNLSDMQQRLQNRLAWANMVPTIDQTARSNYLDPLAMYGNLYNIGEQSLMNRYNTQENIFARLFGLQEDTARNRLNDLFSQSSQGVAQYGTLAQQFQQMMAALMGNMNFTGATGAQGPNASLWGGLGMLGSLIPTGG